MAQSVIGALRVNLGLDSAQFERGARRVQKPLAVMRSQFLLVAGAAAAMGGAISAAALKSSTEIDRLAKAGKRIDTTVGGMRALELAAGEAGVSVGSLTDAVQNIGRDIAAGTAGSARALKTLGLAAQELEGLEADQKLALIADRVKALGLTTGETSALLRDFGVRNRDMVLLLAQGGDALRSARTDVADYGLAINAVDTAALETANDQIGRLGLITQYAGQQLAVALVPALGAMAQAMTDSLREGGLLRTMLDGLTGNIVEIGQAVGFVVTALGIRYVGALAAARLGTIAFTSATVLARGAVIALGGPVGILWGLIGGAAAAWLVYGTNTDTAEGSMQAAQASQVALNAALGTFHSTAAPGAAAKAIDLANANYKLADSALAAAKAELAKQQATMEVAVRNDKFGPMAGPRPSLVQPQLDKAASDLTKAQSLLADAERARDRTARAVTGSMSEVMTTAVADTQSLNVEVEGLDVLLGKLGGGGGGSSAKAAEGVDKLAQSFDGGKESASQFQSSLDELNKLQSMDTFKSGALKDLQSSMSDFLFDPFKDGVRGMVLQFSDGLRRMAADALSARLTQSIVGLFAGLGGGGGGFGGFGTSIPMFASGTDYAPGGMAIVGERGPELVNLPRGSQVIPNDKMGGAGPTIVNVMDPSIVGDYLNSPGGEQVIVNVMRRNGFA